MGGASSLFKKKNTPAPAPAATGSSAACTYQEPPEGASAFPEIRSKHSLVAKHVTKEKWDKLCAIKTATSGFTLAKAIACAVQFDDQHCGIYAGDEDSYKDFADVFDP